MHRRPLIANAVRLLAACVLVAILSGAPVVAMLAPLAETASWGPDQPASGHFGDTPSAELECISLGEAWSYESTPGRTAWLSRDPIAERGGLNLYGYVRNSPINRTDYLGLIGEAIAEEAFEEVSEITAPVWEPAEKWAECEAAAAYEKVVEEAKALYPKLAGLKDQLHHICPKFLGGDPNGPLSKIPAAYHQLITNLFRALAPYGGPTPSPQQTQEIMQKVYTTYPLPPQGF